MAKKSCENNSNSPQEKKIMRYHYFPLMETIKKKNNTKYWQGYGTI